MRRQSASGSAPGVRARREGGNGFAENPYLARGLPSTKRMPAISTSPQQVAASGGLPHDPGVAAALERFGGARDRALTAIGGEQSTALDTLGIVRDANGNPVYGENGQLQLSTANPASKAAIIQRQWQNARNAHYQGAGRNLYAGSYQTQLGLDAKGEQDDNAALLLQAQGMLGEFETRRAGAWGDYETSAGGVLGDYAGNLAAQPGPQTTPAQLPAASRAGGSSGKKRRTVRGRRGRRF